MRIFMTGGAGFLGRAIMRRVSLFGPNTDFTIYSRDEGKQAKARSEFQDARFILGDVRDLDRMELAMAGHDLVIHAAAMKYVPQSESNVWEAYVVNVDGSRNVALAASRMGVDRVIGISTDKACGPVNIYGATKWAMEKLFVEANTWPTPTNFSLVRYGNVIGSTGSVIPFFRGQAHEGTITITNPAMTRFWTTVEGAVRLIVEAMKEPTGGTILIPRLPSATMGIVAEACAQVEGVIGCLYRNVGQRFGEKIHEDLLSPIEAVYALAGNPTRLYPTVEGPRDRDIQSSPYSSDEPDYTLTIEDMVQMIVEAEKDAE